MPDRVVGHLSGCFGVIGYTEQVINGMRVLISTQPVMSYLWSGRHPGSFSLLQFNSKPIDHLFDFFFSGLSFLFRRHFTGIYAIHHFKP